MNTIQFFEDEHQKAERFLNTLESCEIDEKNCTDSVICYIGWTYKGEQVKVLIHE
jgi:hypothetical protein